MKTIKQFLILTLAVVMALPASAYEDTSTHHVMTLIATQKSVLYQDPSIMFALGVRSIATQGFLFHGRAGDVPSGTKLYTLAPYMAEGSVAEDSPATRALSHFYDPAHDRPLTVLGLVSAGFRSWEWMLEETPISAQENSLSDAREALTRGLTFNEGTAEESEAQRFFAISLMFKNLGHVMHHMQDMAQPQHVRNDQHLSYLNINPSRYEAYTAELGGSLVDEMQQGTPVFPGSTDFKTARDFWFNDNNSGIAQKTNRDFLSQGTNFLISSAGVSTGEYAQPQPGGHVDISAPQLFSAVGMTMTTNLQAQCANPAINCTVTMYATPMSNRASTLSVFDQDLRAKGIDVDFDWSTLGGKAVTRRFFDLNRFNYNDVYRELMPRAVAYSAGIVNHFFRGKLEVSKPESGPYAVVDQAPGEGFKKIRATVKNVTPQEALQAGTIRAIARFRRNACYKPDLTGEWELVGGQAVAPCASPRSVEAHIRVSDEQSAAMVAGESKQFTFTFEDPIPLDATDVMLQVYFTGKVGEEEGSFALGAVDIAEPTFVAMMNATDLFELFGKYYYGDEIIANIATAPYSAADLNDDKAWSFPPDPPLDGININYEIFVQGMKVADAPTVPEGRFIRLAVLVDPGRYEVVTVARGSWFTKRDTYSFIPKIVQDNGQQTLIQTTGSVRQLRQYNIATYHNYYPQGTASIDLMMVSNVTDADKPVSVTIAPSLLAVAAPSSEWTRSMNVFGAVRANAFSSMWPNQDAHRFPQPVAAPSPEVVLAPPAPEHGGH